MSSKARTSSRTGARPARYGPSPKTAAAREQQRRAAHRRTALRWGSGVLAAAVVVVGLDVVFNHAKSGASSHAYQVASPGIGATAPGFTLAADTGGTISLSALRGRSVLLFFQEGLTCQPCWDQIKQIEAAAGQVKAAGIDETISITSDPVDLIAQKAKDMGLTTTVLSDPGLAVSAQYHANQYGMMGAARDGHTFILVGPDGIIRWRADYGGPPAYTMDVPVSGLLSDLKAGARP